MFLVQALSEMGNLYDFQNEQIMGACLAGASVTLTAKLFGILRTRVFMIMTAYTEHSKASSVKNNSGRKPKVNHRESQRLRRIVSK